MKREHDRQEDQAVQEPKAHQTRKHLEENLESLALGQAYQAYGQHRGEPPLKYLRGHNVHNDITSTTQPRHKETDLASCF
jgi:hypothetical protein